MVGWVGWLNWLVRLIGWVGYLVGLGWVGWVDISRPWKWKVYQQKLAPTVLCIKYARPRGCVKCWDIHDYNTTQLKTNIWGTPENDNH